LKEMYSMKNKYREFCLSESTIPIFSQSWWLDTVCGDSNWNVSIVEKGGEIFATMPYYERKKYGLIFLRQPTLTQTLGPWFRDTNGKYSKTLAQQKELMQVLIEQLPPYHVFTQNWHFTNTNWLPFFWKGFKQTTKITYRLSDLTNIDELWEGLQGNIRKEIKKAEKLKVTLKENPSIEDFLELNKKVFIRQNKKLPYSEEIVKNIHDACTKNNCSKIFMAEDSEGRNHAAVYIIWDTNSAYYLLGGGDPELRSSGATSLCMWEAIKFSATVTKGFDFEGSMLEPIERFFRAFGAIQTPYHSISKSNSKAYDLIQAVRSVVR
jgi:lipid II:glycine glycyltransferase (peptidoglycan interpeptide bridge formation enzyme)